MILEGTGTLWEGHSSSQGGDREAYFSVPMYRDLRDGTGVFEGLLASAPRRHRGSRATGTPKRYAPSSSAATTFMYSA